MHPHRLNRAAWQIISEFERDLDQQMREIRAVLIKEFSESPSRATKRTLTAPQEVARHRFNPSLPSGRRGGSDLS